MKLLLLVFLTMGSMVVANDMVTHTECGFSIDLPNDMENRAVDGIDSCVVMFSNDDDSKAASFDVGMYSSTYSEFSGYPNYSRAAIEIDGKDAELIRFDLEYMGEMNYCLAVYIPKISQWIDVSGEFCSTLESDLEQAKSSMRSIRLH